MKYFLFKGFLSVFLAFLRFLYDTRTYIDGRKLFCVNCKVPPKPGCAQPCPLALLTPGGKNRVPREHRATFQSI